MKPFLTIALLFAFVVCFGQDNDFGIYDIRTTGTISNVLDANSEQSIPDFNTFALDSIVRDGYYKEYYKPHLWYPKLKHLKMEGNFKNGKRDGYWILYSNVNRIYEGNYIAGRKEGVWKGIQLGEVEPDSIHAKRDTTDVFWQGTFINDTLNGLVREWNYGITLINEWIYKNGKLEGIAKKYYPNSNKIQQLTHYHDSLKDGEQINYSYKNYDEDGNLNGYSIQSIVSFSKGQLSGPCLTFDIEEGFSSSENYLKGEKDGKCIYISKDDGTVIIDYTQGVYSGEYSRYYSNGQPEYKLIFRNGLPYTSIFAYSDSGKVLDEGSLKEGNGILKSYNSNGSLESFCTYRNQRINGPLEYYGDSGKILLKGNICSTADTTLLANKGDIEAGNINAYVGKVSELLPGTKIEEYYDNGKSKYLYSAVTSDTSFYKGCIHYFHYNEDSKIQEEYYYKHHLNYGLYKTYEGGQLTMEENFKIVNGYSVRDGLNKYYYKNGKKKAEVYFKNGIVSGHSNYYDTSGVLVRQSIIEADGTVYNVFKGDTVNRRDRHGLKQGKWISLGYFFNYYNRACSTCPISIEYYKDGVPMGTWLYYYDNANGTDLKFKLVWQDSIKAYEYDYVYCSDSLTVKAEGYTLGGVNNIMDGHWKIYNTDSKKSYLQWEGDYNFNRKIGVWKEYKKNGKLKWEGNPDKKFKERFRFKYD